MPTPDKTRRVLMAGAGLLCAGLVYLAFFRWTGWGIPCVFYQITGLRCPGCGVTRMCLKLLEGDWAGAARHNLGLAVLLPLALPGIVHQLWCWCRSVPARRWSSILLWVCAALLFVWAAVRNLIGL